MRSSTVPALPRPVVDVALAVAVFIGTAALVIHGLTTPDAEPGRIDSLGFLLVAGASAPLVLWRVSPATVFVVTAGFDVLLAAFGYPVELLPGPIAALYAFASSRDESTPWTVRHTALALSMLVALLAADAVARGAFPALVLTHTGLVWAVACA